MNIYVTENLYAGYKSLTVLHDININIKQGEFTGMIGPNGAGKSTLLKVLSNNLIPERGMITFKDAGLSGYDRKSLSREMSVVHQSMENIMPFTVYDFIRMGRFPHQKIWGFETDDDIQVIEHAIDITGISHLRDRKLTELSGGERQLVRIAQSLSQSSRVILLDEPISHLDISHSIHIMDILMELNKGGITLISVLHDINIASDYCSRIIGIKEGKIFFDGVPEKVMTYRNVEELFSTICVADKNPVTGKPFIYPVPGYTREKQ